MSRRVTKGRIYNSVYSVGQMEWTPCKDNTDSIANKERELSIRVNQRERTLCLKET